MNIVERARIFATAAHAAVGQKRKYTGEDYIVHPLAVMELVRSVPHDDNMLAAALMHDVIEDTQVTIELIRSEFGDDVAELVDWLTDVSRPEDGNRAVRKAKDCVHTAAAPARAKTIKLADLADNGKSIGAYDPSFARVYQREKEALLAVLTEGDPTLYEMAARTTHKMKEKPNES
jgi:(p)ppGpp synthase/HD superfamily hydrolase